MLLKTFSSTVSVGLPTVLPHIVYPPTLLLRCTPAVGHGLMQVRGAKSKYGGIAIDAERDRKRKHRLTNYHKKKPLISEFRMRKKIDLPYLVTSLSAYDYRCGEVKGSNDCTVRVKVVHINVESAFLWVKVMHNQGHA